MKVAAIYDLHGNLPALEAVLADIRLAKVDLLVAGGDILPGPMPREMLDCLLNLEIPTKFIQGNGEIDALLSKQNSITQENARKSREMLAESMTVQRLAVKRQRSVTIIAIPGILACMAAIAYLVWKYL